MSAKRMAFFLHHFDSSTVRDNVALGLFVDSSKIGTINRNNDIDDTGKGPQ